MTGWQTALLESARGTARQTRAAPGGKGGQQHPGLDQENTVKKTRRVRQNLFHREDTVDTALSKPVWAPAGPGSEVERTDGPRRSAPSPVSPWPCWGKAACEDRTGPPYPVHAGHHRPQLLPSAGEERTDRPTSPGTFPSGLSRLSSLPRPSGLSRLSGPPRPAPDGPLHAPESAAHAGAEAARGPGGTMASGKERLDRRGAGRALLDRAQVLRGAGRALLEVPEGCGEPGGRERGQAGLGLTCGCCRCGAVAGEEGGGGSRGFRQKQGQGRRAAPQRERERPSPGDGVEGPAGGKSHQNVRHWYPAAWLQGLLVSFGLEKSTLQILTLRDLTASALSWELPCCDYCRVRTLLCPYFWYNGRLGCASFLRREYWFSGLPVTGYVPFSPLAWENSFFVLTHHHQIISKTFFFLW